MTPAPYYADDTVTLYLGDMRDVLPALDLTADLIVTDPPYGCTPLPWDRWPADWPRLAAQTCSSLWCFGSLRMFLAHAEEFTAAGWRLSQDVVWQKNTGSGFDTDRFKRVHELAVHWYQGAWRDVYQEVPRLPHSGPRAERPISRGATVHRRPNGGAGPWKDDGTRLTPSVIYAKNMHRRALHPCEKPAEILAPLLLYGCPPGGTVLDPFAGSGSTLVAARLLGRHAIGIEANAEYAAKAADRLAQNVLPLGDA